jgi:hypothetical protein
MAPDGVAGARAVRHRANARRIEMPRAGRSALV